jgi:hypothetical protein
MKEKLRQRWPDLLALLGYTLLSLAYLWPLVRKFSRALAGDGFDMYVFQWANWWITHALRHGQSPYHTEMIFYPQGADLYFLSFSWLNTFVWWPLQAIIGNSAAYNFTVWWSWPLAGFGAYLLAREVSDDRRAAFVAGLIYAFFPYHFAQRNHLNLLSVQWIPFSLFFLIRSTRRSSVLDGILSGFFFAFSGLSGWHLMTLSGLLGGLWVVYAYLSGAWAEGSWRALLALALTVALLTGPLLAPLAWEQFANPEGQDPYLGKEKETQTDLLAYFVPNLYHPLFGDLAAPVHRRFLRNKDHAVALGYLPLALLLYGALRWRKNRRARFWLIGFLIFWLLALGPFPRINGEPYPGIPLPYRLVGWNVVVRSLRNPERFNIIVGLCLALAAGVSAAELLRHLSRRRAIIIIIAMCALVMIEYWAWPFPTRSPDVPAFYGQLAEESGDFAIVDLPITNDLSKRYMYYQTAHGKPTVTGHVSRPPEDAHAFIESHDTLRALWREHRPPDGHQLSEDSLWLREKGIRYIVVHRNLMDEEEWKQWQRYADIEPMYKNDLYVYDVGVDRTQ